MSISVEAPTGFHILFWQTANGGHVVLKGEAGPSDTANLTYAFQSGFLPPGSGVTVDSTKLVQNDAERMITEALKRLSESTPVFATPVCDADNLNNRPLWQLHSYNLPATRWASAFARSQVDELARELGLMKKDIETIKIAVGEAVTNAVRHGCGWRPDNTMGFTCTAGPENLEITVTDCGPGFNPGSPDVSAPRKVADGGHGLSIMKRLVDELHISCEGGTTVRLIKHIRKEDK